MIAMEVHSLVVYGNEKIQLKNATEMHLFFDMMYEKGNYHVVDTRDNLFCPKCLEVLFVRHDCGEKISLAHKAYEAALSGRDLMMELERLRKEYRKASSSKFCNARFENLTAVCP